MLSIAVQNTIRIVALVVEMIRRLGMGDSIALVILALPPPIADNENDPALHNLGKKPVYLNISPRNPCTIRHPHASSQELLRGQVQEWFLSQEPVGSWAALPGSMAQAPAPLP